MIIEQHYDDEVLIGLLKEAEEDSHVPACDTCAGTLESYRDLSSALNDQSVWDEREVSEAASPKTTNFLRDFAARAKAEDAAARPIVAKLIADPTLIEQHPEWRTAGVVRGVLAHFDTQRYADPKSALEVATMAAAVSESIDCSRYPRTTLTSLRAFAFKEKAWALFYVGAFAESVTALNRADEHLTAGIISECDSAEIAVLRARVYRDLERFDDALRLAAESERVFRKYGNRRRAAVAQGIRSAVLMDLRRYSQAFEIDDSMAADHSLDEDVRACAVNRTAISLREMMRFREAKTRFAEAIQWFEQLGAIDKRSMARWGLARVLLDEGSGYEAALSVFNELRVEFEEMGLAHDLALVSLDAVAALIALDRTAEIVDLCKSAMDYFAKAGLEYTQAALTGLAYLKEAAAAKTLTPRGVGQVRAYFELLPKQPHLLFAFPL